MASSGAGARLPVIVGVGEISHRSKDPAQALEPLALMQRALAAAEADAGVAGLLARVDSIDVVCEYSWPYDDAPGRLAARLGAQPGWRHYGEPGGESPVRLLHEAALRIARGDSEIALVTGAEARYSVEAAAKAGVDLTRAHADAPDFAPWAPRDTTRVLPRGPQLCHPTVTRHGMAAPITLYPLYENATAAAWGQTPRQARAESAQIWADFAAAAAVQPAAWARRLPSRDEIEAVGDDNRLICWPYTRHLVANPLVNLGAGLLLTHEDQARALGIAPSRWIYVSGGSAASEPRDLLARDDYRHSVAQERVLEAALALAGGDVGRFAALELYSCFPVVPKMARRTPDGARLMARVAGDDAATIAALTDLDAAPDALVGRVGTVIPGGAEADALLHWTLQA